MCRFGGEINCLGVRGYKYGVRGNSLVQQRSTFYIQLSLDVVTYQPKNHIDRLCLPTFGADDCLM